MKNNNLTKEDLLNIRIAIVAAEVIGYAMTCINAKMDFKNRTNIVKNSVKSLESYFSHDPNINKELLRDEYVLFYSLLKETIDFDSLTLEEIIEAIKNNVEKVDELQN